MRRIVFAISCLLAFGPAHAAEVLRADGIWWQGASDSQKLGYVIGFVDGMSTGQLMSVVRICTSDSLRPTDMGARDCYGAATERVHSEGAGHYSGITFGQFVDGLDAFYRDYRNRQIVLPGAMNHTAKAIKGTPKAELDEMAERMRASNAKPTP